MTDQLTEQPTEAERRVLDRYPEAERIEREFRLLHLQQCQSEVAHAWMLFDRAWRVLQEAGANLQKAQRRLHDAIAGGTTWDAGKSAASDRHVV
jgi:hypothetical protein